MKVWMTKRALTQGIYWADAEITESMAVVERSGYSEFFYGEGRDWHWTEAKAIQRAEAMRTAKIASLKKSIAKFEKLRFVPVTVDAGGGE